MKLEIYTADVELNEGKGFKPMIVITTASGVLCVDYDLFSISFDSWPPVDSGTTIKLNKLILRI